MAEEYVRSKEDIDKFFDKFEDPAYEIKRLRVALGTLFIDWATHRFLDDRDTIIEYFIKRLIMKAYRLGKEHAYAASIQTIRDRGTTKEDK